MRYVDLGNSSRLTPRNKRSKRKKYLLITGGVFLVSLVAVVGYAFFWPILELLKNPGIALSFFQNGAQLQSTDGKTNVLLLGIDKRANVPYTFIGPSGQEKRNGFLSDTIIVATFNHETKKVSLISIPRDTWVSLPSWENFPATQGKINSAFSTGDVFGYPGGGIELTRRIVGDNLGIPIHYVGRIDFQGFEKIVDTLSGINVNVETSFDDYRYPVPGKESTGCSGGGDYCRFEHLHFDAGPNHMDGKTALAYARSRSGTNGEGSDFARARRQQKVIEAVIKKSLSLENILNPLTLNNLFHDLGLSVETNFDLAAIPQAVGLAKELDLNNMETFVLDPSSEVMIVADPNLYGGAYAILPVDGDWSQVKKKVDQFLNSVQETQNQESE